MSVLKQPFQMLPFSPNLEFQFRLRSDCFNDICEVPIIPQGKFIPFAVIADSDEISEITLKCWNDPFEYTRTETFEKYCTEGNSFVQFSKIYYSTISTQDARQKAYQDENYYLEGSQYAEDNGVCETHYALKHNNEFFLTSTGGKFKLS